ncbi:MAG: hypothetical protein R3B48_19885 [Kofleriaceae bacterium]
MKNPIRTGTMIAMTAASLFVSACGSKAPASQDNTMPTEAPAEQTAAAVHCQGINECKGTAMCKTASNECKGMNACKGQGWVEVASADECTGKQGTVVE